MNTTKKQQAVQDLFHLKQEIESCIKNGDASLTVSQNYIQRLRDVIRTIELLDNRYSTLRKLIIEESKNASEFEFEAALKQILIKERSIYTDNQA